MYLVALHYCTIDEDFTEAPSPLLLIVTLEEEHTYMCNHSATKSITWRVNDQVLGVEIHDFPGIQHTDILTHPGGAEVYTLTIRALPQNNQTTIQCTAAFSGGAPPESTPTASFLIQGM